MTPQQLKALIDSDAEATSLFAAKQDAECAARCVTISTATHQPTEQLSDRGMYKLLGPTVAETILQKLKTYSGLGQEYSLVVARFLTWLEPNNQGVDFGDPALLQLCDGLTLGGLLTNDENQAIKSISLKKPTITAADIEKIRIAYGVF